MKVRAEEKTNAAAEGALDGGQGTDRETVASGMAKEQSGVEASAPREKVSAPREKLKLSDEAVADNERAAARPAEKRLRIPVSDRMPMQLSRYVLLRIRL